MAAECAHAQGKFWEYHDKLFENQRALGAENLNRYAEELELEMAAFEQCLASDETRATVQAEYEYAGRMGVNSTPAFFINGRFLSGAQPLAAFTAIIDDELSN